MSEHDDIARIAALRGRPAANYLTGQHALNVQARAISPVEIIDLFVNAVEPRHDLRVFDALPRGSRELLVELPFCASAAKYADLLARVGDEAALIATVRAYVPTVAREWVRRHYGPAHPTMRRLP